MDENTENLLEALARFTWPDPPKITYRLYHDDLGNPISYTMEDLPGNYIEIGPEDFFLSSMDSKVINGKLFHPVKNLITKLRPSSSGTPCHPQNVCVVVDQNVEHIKWSLSSNEKDRYSRP